MRHRRADRGCGDGCASGIREQIQHADRAFITGPAPPAVFPADEAGEPFPVDCLFRKQTGMLEGKRFEMEGQIRRSQPVRDLPLLRQISEFPFTAARL